MSIPLSTIPEDTADINIYDFPVFDYEDRQIIRDVVRRNTEDIISVLKSKIKEKLYEDDVIIFITISRIVMPKLDVETLQKLSQFIYIYIPIYHPCRYLLLNLFNYEITAEV
jgi:exonuclease V gamma subunit